jgi:hypothetical protein
LLWQSASLPGKVIPSKAPLRKIESLAALAALRALRAKTTLLIIALANETCVSRGDCASYEILRGYTTRSLQQAIDKGDKKIKGILQENARKSCELVAKYTNGGNRLLINPLLETRMPRKTFAKAASWVKEACPKAEIVWNPVGGNPGAPQAPATISEGHGECSCCVAGGARGLGKWKNHKRNIVAFAKRRKYTCPAPRTITE